MKGLELIKKAFALEEVERVPWVPFAGRGAGWLERRRRMAEDRRRQCWEDVDGDEAEDGDEGGRDRTKGTRPTKAAGAEGWGHGPTVSMTKAKSLPDGGGDEGACPNAVDDEGAWLDGGADEGDEVGGPSPC